MRRWWALGAMVVLGIPMSASAGNGIHPRTQPLFTDPPCFAVVDRSVDPIFQLDYDIPFEDTDVSPDEVANSRTHQFFALCRQFHPQIFLPNWITWTDIDQAAELDLVKPAAVEDHYVFETAQAWDGCWFRLNGDDERRPITYEDAADPVPWNTTAVPVGTYSLWGYTYEPPLNLWTQRWGTVVKVIDGGDPADIGPGGAITTGEQIAYAGDTVPIEGCVDALPGSTMTGSYASTEGVSDPEWEPQWVPFAENVDVEGENFTIDLVAPDDGAQTVIIRVDFTDPMDRTYEAYMKHPVSVLPGMGSGCEEGGNIIGPGCNEEGSGTTEPASTGGAADTSASASTTDGLDTGNATTGATAPADDDETAPGEKGCGCRSARGEAPIVLLLLLAVRRRVRATGRPRRCSRRASRCA